MTSLRRACHIRLALMLPRDWGLMTENAKELKKDIVEVDTSTDGPGPVLYDVSVHVSGFAHMDRI